MLKTLKNNKYPLLALVISTCLMLIIYFTKMITPFGDNSLFNVDLFHQYAPLFNNLIEKISSGESLVYSTDAGTGATFLGNIFNYMFSPFNAIIVLLGKDYLQETISWVILIKTALSAFTFTYVTQKTSKVNDVIIVCFGLMYAFSAHFVAYFWNIMWLDAVYTLPIIVYGIYKLINEDKISIYVLSLAYAIITNYYMGYMLCIASVITFFVAYFMKYNIKDTLTVTKNNIQKTQFIFIHKYIHFVIASLFAGAISAFVLIPAYNILQESSAMGGEITNRAIYFSPMNFLANHMSFSETTFRSNHTSTTVIPNIFFGIFPFIIYPLYLFNSKISTKEKKIVGILILFFYCSFAFSGLDYIWHGFHFPNDIPYRFAFIYIFFMLIIAIRGYTSYENTSAKWHTILCSLMTILFLIVGIFYAPNKTTITIPITIVLMIIYEILFYKLVTHKSKKLVSILMLILVCIEVTIPCITFVNTTAKSDFATYTEDIQEIQNEIKDEWYRMELLNNKTWNDSLIYNYNGISSFSSVNYTHSSRTQKQLGLCSNGLNTTIYHSQTPIYNLMFGVNYIVDNFEENVHPVDDEYASLKYITQNGLKLYENKYKTQIGFSVVKDVCNTKMDFEAKNPFDNQNKFIEFATGLSNSITNITNNTYITNDMNVAISNDCQTFTYTVEQNAEDAYVKIANRIEEEGHYYAFVLTDEFDVTYDIPNKDKITQSCTTKYIYTQDVGRLNVGDSFDVYVTASERTEETGSFCYFVCKINDDVISDAYNIIQNNGILNVEKQTDDYIKTTINTKTGNIYTSIPYDKNWKIVIDGKMVDNNNISTINDSFIALKTTQGEHTIEFVYETPNLYTGCFISIVALALFIAFSVFQNKKHKHS